MANIILHCYYPGRDGSARAFVEEMISSGIQDEVRNEDGCLQYDYFLSAQDPETAVLLEKWRDAEALNAHMVGEPMKHLKAVKARHGLETVVERYDLKE